MPIDREALRSAALRARATLPTGLAGALSRLRTDPALRDELTLETIALPPVPAADGASLSVFFVRRLGAGPGPLRVIGPWAVVRVAPDGVVQSFERLPVAPAEVVLADDPPAWAHRASDYARALEAALPGGPDALAPLAEAWRDLVPDSLAAACVAATGSLGAFAAPPPG